MAAAEPAQDAVDVTPGGDVAKNILFYPNDGGNVQTPPKGAMVEVHYEGFLVENTGTDTPEKEGVARFVRASGAPFDSSRERGQPFKFKLFGGTVIKGFDFGVSSMVRGEKCDVFMRSSHAYGANGTGGVIPPDSDLLFEIELLGWEGYTPLVKRATG
jgi:FKBP-type peptidyl-prolyl cis-trans isomerase